MTVLWILINLRHPCFPVFFTFLTSLSLKFCQYVYWCKLQVHNKFSSKVKHVLLDIYLVIWMCKRISFFQTFCVYPCRPPSVIYSQICSEQITFSSEFQLCCKSILSTITHKPKENNCMKTRPLVKSESFRLKLLTRFYQNNLYLQGI